MPLISIVIVVLRLFSLVWIVEGAISFLLSLPSFLGGAEMLLYAGNLLLKPIVGAIIFRKAQPIARVITPASAAELSPIAISPHLLYSFAFTFLGLWFALSSVGETFNWLWFNFAQAATPDLLRSVSSEVAARSIASVVTFVAGLACLLCASRLARRFEILQKRYDAREEIPGSPS